MDFTTLTGLRTVDGSIRAWLNNSTVPATTILEEAEAYLYSRLRVREMMGTATGTIGSGSDSVALPDDYLRMERMAITGEWAHKLALKDGPEIEAGAKWDENGARLEEMPTAYYTRGTIAQFENPADDAYPYRAVYYARPVPLGTGNETNFVTSRYPRMLRATCLAFASEWLKKADDKQYWLTIAENEIRQANVESEAERRRDSFMMVTTRD